MSLHRGGKSFVEKISTYEYEECFRAENQYFENTRVIDSKTIGARVTVNSDARFCNRSISNYRTAHGKIDSRNSLFFFHQTLE